MPFSEQPSPAGPTRFGLDSQRVSAAWRWLGLEGVVLLAALLGDLLIVFPAAFDAIGPKGRDLLLLPGIFAICACALWARKRPAEAALAAAGVLIASTMLISASHASAYSVLLSNLSLSETVAGVELVFFCVSRLSAPVASVTVSCLVLAALFAIVRRGHHYPDLSLAVTLAAGGVLLVVAVVAGLRFRKAKAGGTGEPSGLTALLRAHWALTGALCLPLFLDLYNLLATAGVRAFPLMCCVTAAAVSALLSTRYPVRAGLALGGLILVSGGASLFTAHDLSITGEVIPLTEVLAGIVTVSNLVRYVPLARSWRVIAALSVSVAVTATGNAVSGRYFGSYRDLPQLFFAALLLLGIAIAIGLFLRARDSERTRALEAAVVEAQTAERMALARELHDVVAHHVTGIVVQAQAAKMMGKSNPALALEALDRIEEAGTDALTAMRRLVKSMRSNTAETQQATTDLAADLRRLIEAGRHGIRTEVDLRLPSGVPHEVGRSALRLVQESLTNVGKHAMDATYVRVLAEVVEGELHLRVENDGTARPDNPQPSENRGGWRSGGFGLIGMRERVELLHGRLIAGPVPGGWLVEAWLPLADTAAQ